MKKLLIVVILIILSNSIKIFAQTDSIKSYLINALEIMQTKSVNKAKIDWNQVKRKALMNASNSKIIRDTYPIIKGVLASLEDAHSNFYPPELVRSYTLGYRATGPNLPCNQK
ncbi:hypothetical protein [Pedobacter agri]|uniref:hypothetical protein n=1 Tax=Pedobacter agri TaxID=454586 RepID=UPI00292DAD5C|nr:hypothetical protein [Pedobacter agri]